MTRSSPPFPSLPEPPALSARDEDFLSRLAAEAVEGCCRTSGSWSTGTTPDGAAGLPAPSSDLRRPVGVFVTICHGEELRGCLGTAEGREPLWEAVPRLAAAAAARDWRFEPVGLDELPALRVEITLLGPLVRLPGDPRALLAGLDPRICGVTLRARGKSGLLLPQVACRLGWDASELLAQVSLKAGVHQAAWRDPDAEILGFRARSWEAVRPGTLPRAGRGPR